jgi:hypothetical protein
MLIINLIFINLIYETVRFRTVGEIKPDDYNDEANLDGI